MGGHRSNELADICALLQTLKHQPFSGEGRQ